MPRRFDLSVEGDLRLSVGGVPARLEAVGRELRLEVDRFWPFVFAGGWRRIGGVSRRLEAVGLTLRVVRRGRLLFTLGAESRSSRLRRAIRRGLPRRRPTTQR